MPNTRPKLIWTIFLNFMWCFDSSFWHCRGRDLQRDRQKLEFCLNVQHSFANTEVWSPFVFFYFHHFNLLNTSIGQDYHTYKHSWTHPDVWKLHTCTKFTSCSMIQPGKAAKQQHTVDCCFRDAVS